MFQTLSAGIPLWPAAAFALILLFFKRSRVISAALALGATGFSLISSLWIFSNLVSSEPQARNILSVSLPWLEIPPYSITVGVLLDPLSTVMLLVVTIVSFLVQVYSLGYMKDDERWSSYYAYISLFTASMLGLVVAPNYVQMFLCWELVGLCSYLLIGFWYFKPEAARAAQKAFLTTRFGDIGFLMGLITIGMVFQTFDFSLVEKTIAEGVQLGNLQTSFVAGLALLLFLGAMGKSGQFPLHVWLPDAMEGPTPVSALIHAATMVVAGVYLVARTFLLFQTDPLASTVVAWIGGFTAFFAATIAVVQTDIKRVLAYSTLSQIGYMILALGCGGRTAAMFHLTTHAFFKALLFLGAGSVIHAVRTNDMERMGGLARSMPKTAVTFLIATLAIAGVPPLAGFWSKDEILASVAHAAVPGADFLYVLAALTAFLTAFYMFRLFFRIFTGQEKTHGHESPWVMTAPLMILAFFSIGTGFLNTPFFHGFSSFLGEEHHGSFHWSVAIGSIVLALAGVSVAALFYWHPVFSPRKAAERFWWIHRLLEKKYYVDEFYGWLFAKVVNPAAWLCATFDRRVVDGGMVDGSGWLTRAFGRLLRKVQTGNVQFYGWVVFATVAGCWIFLKFRMG